MRLTPRTTIALLTVLALAALGLAACGRSGAHGAAGSEASLKVASQKGGTRALMEAAGELNGVPYKIEWSEFPSAQTLLEALGAGAVDVGAVGDAPYMFAYASGAKIKAVQAIRAMDSASTAIVVPGGSAIRSPADLKGRRIATGRGSIGHYFLLLVLERERLKPSDVTINFLSPGDAKAALAAGSIDAWSTWAPYVPLAVRDHARVVVDSRNVLNGIGFEAATEQAIGAKRNWTTSCAVWPRRSAGPKAIKSSTPRPWPRTQVCRSTSPATPSRRADTPAWCRSMRS